MEDAAGFPKLLLVEDDPDDVLFFRRALTKQGFHFPLVVTHDGEEAIAYLSGQGLFADRELHPLPTHVILDLKLPKKSGLEVLEWMRKHAEFARLPAAVLSSSAQGSDVHRARGMGIDHYWMKPVAYEDLRRLIERVMEWVSAKAPRP